MYYTRDNFNNWRWKPKLYAINACIQNGFGTTFENSEDSEKIISSFSYYNSDNINLGQFFGGEGVDRVTGGKDGFPSYRFDFNFFLIYK